MAQEKLNRAFGLAPRCLVTGIDGGDGDAEFLAPPLDDLNVARVMEEMAAAGWFTVRQRAGKVDVRVGIGVAAQQAFELLLWIGRLCLRRRREPGAQNNCQDEWQRQPVRQTDRRSLVRWPVYASSGSKRKTYISCGC